eukprot:gene6364-6431_t
MIKKTHFALSAVLLAGVAAGAIVANHAAEQSLVDRLARNNVSVANVNTNLLTGVVDLQNVEAKSGSGQIHIGHIKLKTSPLALIGSAQAAAGDDIKLEDISATFGPFEFDIPELVVAGSNLSQDALESMFDPKGTGTIAERVAKLNATGITSDEVTVTTTFGDQSSETTYSGVKATNINQGIVAALTVDSAETSMDGNGALDISATIGAITATNINLPVYMRVITETAKGDESPVPMVDSLAIKDFALSAEDDKSEGGSFKIAAINYSNLKARPLKVSFADFIKTASAQKPGQKPRPEDAAQGLAAASDILMAFEGSAELKDLSFAPLNDKTGPKGKIDRIMMLDFGKGGIGTLGYEGLSVDAEDGHVSIGSFGLKGLILSPFFTAMAEASKSDFKDFNPRASLPTLAQFSINKIDFDVPDDKKQGNAANGARIKGALGKFEVNQSNVINGIPSTISTVIEHIIVDVPKDSKDENMKQLMALGISKLDLSAKLDLAYADATQDITVKELSASGADIGKLTISGKIGNVSKDIFNTNTNLATAAALAAVVKSLDVKLENAGLLDKIIAEQAKAQGKSADDFKKEMIGMAAIGIPAVLGGDGAAGKVIAAAVSKFVADPKNLHLAATSKDGLGAGDIGLINNPADLLKKVDVTAGANE